VDIRTEKNTDVEGAVIASGTGNLKLDTGTLTYKDISDRDTGSNTQVGVSVPLGSAIGGDKAPAAQNNTQDQPGALEKFLGGSTLDASYDSHDRQQVNRATIGEGTTIIRPDPSQGLAGLNRDLKRAQELTKNSKTTVKVYVDPAAIKEIVGGFEGIRQDTSKLLDVVEAVLPPELKPQVLSIRWVKQELLAQGYSETRAWELANNPIIRVWMQNEREAEALVQKYGSVENIPETARAEFYNTIARNFKSENIGLEQFPDAVKVVRCDWAALLGAVETAPRWVPAAFSSVALFAIISRQKISEAAQSAGEAFKNLEEDVKQKVTELQKEGKLPGYGDTGEQPVTTTPPQRQTTVNDTPGGTADNSGAVAPLPGGANVVQGADDWSITTPSRTPTPWDFIFLSSPNQMEQEILRGQAPKSITRIDTEEKQEGRTMDGLHVHFSDGSALGADGTWKHGGKTLTRSEKMWLIEHGWKLPK